MKHILLIFCTSLFLFTCQKKKFDFEFVDSKCRNFKIDYGRIQSLGDPSCNEAPALSSGSAIITFDYNGDKDCIDGVVLSAEFYNSTSSTISGVSYVNELSKSDITINESAKTIEFTFNYTFSSTGDADNMNHFVVNMEVKKPSGQKSNKILVRYNSVCFTPDVSSYTVQSQTLSVNTTETIYLYDSAADDGDIVSVYIEGTTLAAVANYRLTKTPQPFTVTFSGGGGQRIIIYAMNQGSSGPNTVGMTVNGTTVEFNLNTNKGYAYNTN